MAVASRCSRVELEAARLRQLLADRDRASAELADRVTALEGSLRDAEAHLRVALDDNVKLTKERDSLIQASKKLARDLAKLEAFKRQLMQSLSDENSSPQDTVDIKACEQSVAKVTSWNDGLASSNHSVSNQSHGDNRETVLRPFEQKISVAHNNPRASLDCIPKLTSAASSPRRFSTAVSPKLTSSATSPTKPWLDVTMSPWFPSSKMSSAASSPPRGRSVSGRTPRIDGKEFFRQVRSRLSYEQFAAFLANIKELNAHRQSREETLKKAEDIFGPDSKDLFQSFQVLLSRSLT